jgi:tetraacyldisaccharide 4'-kinase
MTLIERAWQQRAPWLYILAPLAWLFALLSAIRRQLFAMGLLKQTKLPIPVIIVGNISVGGNGKTPVVLAIAQYLRQQGFKPGIISRGYGGQCQQFPHRVRPDDTAQYVGDEPRLLAQQAQCPVVIDPQRVRAGQSLLADCDVIISDDGLQHYALVRDLEIVVMDNRQLGNGWLLPVGFLREGAWRLNTVDIIVHNSTSQATCKPVLKRGATEDAILPLQVPMTLATTALKRVVDDVLAKPPATYELALAGIGNPQRFFSQLDHSAIAYQQTKAFADHYPFSASDLAGYHDVIMTQKDAMKCRAFAPDSWHYLQVEAQLSDAFYAKLTATLKEHHAV